MGVRGLKTFINNNSELFVKDHQLFNTSVIVDAYNLIGYLLRRSQKYKRRELSNEDIEQFECNVRSFFHNFKKCDVEAIMVFDGEATPETGVESAEDIADSNKRNISVIKTRFGVFLPPVTATTVFKSMAVENGIRIVDCIREADTEITLLARALEIPVISNDSDFYLIDLPRGLIPIDLIKYNKIKSSSKHSNKDHEGGGTPQGSHDYIACSIYYQDYLTQYFSNLNKNNLPLLGVLAGNDFIRSKLIERICAQLPLARIAERHGVSTKQFRKMNTKQQEKIIKILYFMCDKTLEENVNKICLHVPKEERRGLKDLIKTQMRFYTIPVESETEISLRLEALSI